jgi:Kef-type K+ transport system membrane component KefB
MMLDVYLVVLFGTAVATALFARWSNLPITALEIVAGIALVTAFSIHFPDEGQSFIVLGSLLIVFLAGFETNFTFLRQNLAKALTVGLGGFLLPFAGIFFLLYEGLHAPLIVSVIGATALADTSISIVYTTLHQFELADLPFGRLILACTLMVNLLEDFAITTTTFLTTPGFLFTLGVLGALFVAAIALPRLSRLLATSPSDGVSFSNLKVRGLLFSLAILAALSALVGVPGILFVFLLGLMFSQVPDAKFLADARRFAFAVFVPFYFIAVGLKVDFPFVIDHWPVLLVIVGAATALKLAGVYPAMRRCLCGARAAPVSVLLNTRLTSATVILLLTSTLGLIPTSWYSLLISGIVILALSSAGALRLFPAFRTAKSAREAFYSEDLEVPDSGPRLPAPAVGTASSGK